MHETLKQWGPAVIIVVATLIIIAIIASLRGLFGGNLSEILGNVNKEGLSDVSKFTHDDNNLIKVVTKSPASCQDVGTIRITCSDCDHNEIITYAGSHYADIDTHKCIWCGEIINESLSIAEKELGDVNNDGIRDSYDVNLIKKAANGSIKLKEDEINRADVNKDGFIDGQDANILMSYINKTIRELIVKN